MLVNNLGYRQSVNILSPSEPGHNVVLTLDMDLEQAAADPSNAGRVPTRGPPSWSMDVRTGDVLAMVSSPAINPDYAANDPKFLADPQLRPQINRATQENYAPGSIFKTIVGLACLEAGLNPEQTYYVQEDPTRPGRGCIYIGRRKIDDTVAPGPYNFKRAIMHSSNAYFITNGLHAGVENIVRLGEQFHLGERTSLPTRQETAGIFPSLADINSSNWHGR